MYRRSKLHIAAFAYLLFATLATPLCVKPQSSPTTITGPSVPFVRVRVTVLDTSNQFVDGLTQKSFRVLEDGKPREITYFSHDPEPLSVMLLVDKSGSMENFDSDTTAAVMRFVRELPAGTDISLIRFNDQAVLTPEHVRSPEELDGAIRQMPARGHTALLDAVYLGLSKMHESIHQKQVLVIFSDGGDNKSRYQENDIRDIAKESDAEIYLVAPFLERGYRPTPEESNGGSIIEDLCSMSGGLMVEAEKSSQLTIIVHQLAQLLQRQYVLGFVPFQEEPGAGRRWRKVSVKVVPENGKQHGHAITRSGFLAAALVTSAGDENSRCVA